MSAAEVLFKTVGPGVLCGITFPEWVKMLRQERATISPACFPRALSITAQSLQNSFLRLFESRPERALPSVTIQPPVFILGHWRSGTTFLHDLLTQDEQFGFPTTYQTSFPLTFLCSESWNAPLLDRLIPTHRPMDKMELGMASPQEDEFALCCLTRLSPWMAWVFPRQKARYIKFLSFRDAIPAQITQWKNAFIYFLKKVQLHDPRPLILKSPPHTARIKLLLQMFPDARFVHIHRHPFEVFQSSRHLFSTIVKWHRLQVDDGHDLNDWILQQYTEMHDCFFQDWPLIPSGQAVELNFASLERDPLGQLQKIYHALNFQGFETMKQKAEQLLHSRRHYQKNSHPALSPTEKKMVFNAWNRSFSHWQYAQ